MTTLLKIHVLHAKPFNRTHSIFVKSIRKVTAGHALKSNESPVAVSHYNQGGT
jgi:hypothetical protein